MPEVLRSEEVVTTCLSLVGAGGTERCDNLIPEALSR